MIYEIYVFPRFDKYPMDEFVYLPRQAKCSFRSNSLKNQQRK